MNTKTTLPTIDDRYLLELATAPAQRLFPVLDRTIALRPLLVLLAVLPVMYAVANRSFSSMDAEWGLRALEVRGALSSDALIFEQELIGHNQSINNSRLIWQPPLVSWLTAAIMQFSGATEPWIVVLVSACSTSGLVFAMFALARALWNDRVAWWAAVIMAIHGPFLMMSQTACPIALPMLCAVGTFWGVICHLKRRPRLMTWPLSVAVISLSGCFLSGGPLAIAVLVPISLYWFYWYRDVSLERQRSGLPPKRRTRRMTLGALGILLLVSLILGGWWSIWMTLLHGRDFVGEWLTGPDVFRFSQRPVDGSSSLYRLLWSNVQVFTAFAAFVMVGIGLAVLRLVRRVGFVVGRRPPAAFLLSWFFCGWVIWSFCVMSSNVSLETRLLWQSFALLAGILFAACAIEAVTQRRLPTFTVVLLTLATGLLLMTVPPQVSFTRSYAVRPKVTHPAAVSGPIALGKVERSDDQIIEHRPPELLPSFSQMSEKLSLSVRVWLTIGLCCFVVVGLWRLYQFLDRHDQRHRVVLIVCLVVVFFLDGLVGWRGVQNRRLKDDVLAMLRRDFESIETVERWSVLASRPIPPSLEYTVHAVWPNAKRVLIDSWDDVLAISLAMNETRMRSTIVIEWKEQTTRPIALRMPKMRVREVGQPRFLWKKRLRTYYIVEEPAKIPSQT
ncbi:ArnT family glycosyltransferase [Thalassoroseus pseudoceratinae]|uniref:ArnT family glycosyltransferase n=1 Tax=Thalassoroseus pseudoceratinae TaxID=2713176 RepID=UPI001421E6EA|nr:glycosyltransferase family 39 protein [Thalassoroseus pseudoceratinae]